LWRMDEDGTDQKQLTDLSSNVSRPQFFPDGSRIFFISFAAGKEQLWQVPADGGDASPVFDADVVNFSISPDGSRLVYSSSDATTSKGLTRIRRLDADMPDKILNILPDGWMSWSTDGRFIYFNTASDQVRNVWSLAPDTSVLTPVTAYTDERLIGCALSAHASSLPCIRQTVSYDAVMIRFD
jgi:Tol biopolymer transport system component